MPCLLTDFRPDELEGGGSTWYKFPEVPKGKGPEMKSTGEAIAFVHSLSDEHFEQPYEMKDLYLSRPEGRGHVFVFQSSSPLVG